MGIIDEIEAMEPSEPDEPGKLYGLWTDNGENVVMHRDYEEERNCVIVSPARDIMEQIGADYFEETGRRAEVKEIDPRAYLDTLFWFRIFDTDGAVRQMSPETYLDEYGSH